MEIEKRLKPLYQNIVVKIHGRPEQTKSGLYLPGTRHPEKYRTGEVVAVGPGRLLKDGKLAPLQVKTGDRVVYNEYMGTKIKTVGSGQDSETYLCMKEDDVWCVYEGEIELNEILDRG